MNKLNESQCLLLLEQLDTIKYGCYDNASKVHAFSDIANMLCAGFHTDFLGDKRLYVTIHGKEVNIMEEVMRYYWEAVCNQCGMENKLGEPTIEI